MRTTVLTLTVLLASSAVGPATVSSASGDGTPPARIVGGPELRLSPSVTRRGQRAVVTVRHLDVPSLELRIVGGTTSFGQRLPWLHLQHRGKGWRVLAPAPEFRGVYPLELRTRRGAKVLRSDHWLLRVFAPGTRSRAAFSTPEGVARNWVRTLPRNARLVALKRWPRPAFDRRDPHRHQLLAVAYTLAGDRTVGERLGMFVTAVRDELQGTWRLLEATVSP